MLENTVFGCVTPNQKRQFVQILKNAGKTVAMTGDGINDVLALKDADCSIAMASGMPQVVMEGRRVVNNIQRSASLFLVKNMFSFLRSLFSVVFMITYPLEPSQISLISMFTIGMPAFFLALEPNKNIIKSHFLTNVFLKALPAALTDVGFMILYKISAPMNTLHAVVLGICVADLLFCSVFLKNLFAVTGVVCSKR